jgi:hypothetical protein
VSLKGYKTECRIIEIGYDEMKKRIHFTLGILLILGILLLTARGTFELVTGQTNSIVNQTSTPTATPAMTTSAQDKASQSIRGAMT